MQRGISRLAQENFDVAVIGGGIYGAWVALDAATRGMSVALVDRGDFGGATSANSQRIIHGGLRYLQHADFKRMRESIRERSNLLRLAPHLVRPLPCLMPAFGSWFQGRQALRLALFANDLIGWDRNRSLQRDRFIPRGRVISKKKFLEMCPGYSQEGLSGGAVFYDAQVEDPNRLILSILQSAEGAGAALANYVRVAGFLRGPDGLNGLQAEDVLSRRPIAIRAKVIVNCSGPWLNQTLNPLGFKEKTRWFKALVLVTRLLCPDFALGLPARKAYRDPDSVFDRGSRFFFITPWRNTSLVGTYYFPFDSSPDEFSITESEIAEFLDAFNEAYPAARLCRRDVLYLNAGLLPRDDREQSAGGIHYMKHFRIIDHEAEDGVKGMISLVGVKLTTARDVAEKAVDLAAAKLRRQPPPCLTGSTPVHGGDLRLSEPNLSGRWQHLIGTYGSESWKILRYFEESPEWAEPVIEGSPVIKAQVIHGVREEMAQKLADIVFRRTDLGTAGYPGRGCLEACADLVGAELGWDPDARRAEIDEVSTIYKSMRCSHEPQLK